MSYHQKQHVLGAKHSEIRRSHAVINARNTSLLPATPSSSTRRHNYSMPRSITRRQTTTCPTLLRVVAFLYAPPPTGVRRSSIHANYAPPFNLASDARQHLRRRAIACTGQSTRRAWWRSRAPCKTIWIQNILTIQNILPSRTIANFQNNFNFLNSHREAITCLLYTSPSPRDS